jgi:ribosomal protein S12 methylthiotransferase
MAFNQSRVGSEIKVIVDDFNDGVFVCRSEFESPEVDGEIHVKYDSSVMADVDPYSLVGEFMSVKVVGADEYDLIAEPVEIL